MVMSVKYDNIKHVEEIPVKATRKTFKKDREVIMAGNVVYESSHRGNHLLHYLGHKYIKNNVHGTTVYWKCTKWHNGCKARAITNRNEPESCYLKNVHNHSEIKNEIM